jgi:hypothetical protein
MKTATDVTVKSEILKSETTATQPARDPALRSLIHGTGFAIGISPGESLKEDGSFELTNSLIYKDVGLAIAQLESVLTHARAYQLQQAFNAGVAQAAANAVTPVAEPEKAEPVAKADPKAVKKSKKK